MRERTLEVTLDPSQGQLEGGGLRRGEGSAKGVAFGREKETPGGDTPHAQQWLVVSKRESPSNIFHSHITTTKADQAPTCLSPNPLAPHQDASEDINKELTKEVLWKVSRWQSKKGKKISLDHLPFPDVCFCRLYLD